MSKDSWASVATEAYIDLHVAYLALLRMRNHRKQALELVIKKDMEQKDPFKMQHPAGEDAVKRWQALWKSHSDLSLDEQVMASVTECIGNHYKSWSAVMDLCPPEFRKFKIDLPYDSYRLTATTLTRETIAQRATILKKAWQHVIKGDFEK